MFAPRFAALLTLTLATVLGAALSANPPAPQAQRQPESDASRQARKDLGEKGYTDLMQALHAARYAVSEEPKVAELGGKPGLVAYSRKQNVRAIFAKDGVRVQAPGTEKSRPTVRLTAAALGRGNELFPLAAAAPVAKANRVEYARGRVTEWYLNDERGLEQGFTIAAPGEAESEPSDVSDTSDGSDPRTQARSAPLTIALSVAGQLRPEAQADGQSVVFRDPRGSATLLYNGLKVWDAKGKVLPCRMTLTEPGSETPLLHHSNTPAPRQATTTELQLRVDDTNAVYPLTIDPLFTSAGQMLTADDAAANDRFGASVAVCGDTVVIGAVADDVGANGNQGSAYVFVRTGGMWSQQAKLTAADGAASNGFGSDVAVNGNTAVVGASGSNGAQGAAYVFVRGGGAWSQQAKLTAGDGAASDFFGDSVAVSGDTAVVGAFGSNSQRGSAYVFVRSGASWGQQAKLTAGDGAAFDTFGTSVAVSGDTAVVGASWDNGFQGSAYVFARKGSVWSQQAQLLAADGAANDRFGTSVAVSGDTAVVGAFGDDVGANGDQGSAYVFVRTGGVWSQQAQLLAADGAAGDRLGDSVAVSGDTAVVGAIYNDLSQGSAYVFRRAGGAWVQQVKLQAGDGAAADEFGTSVAVSGNTTVVGAGYDDTSAADTGSAHVFDLVTGEAQLLADDGEANDRLGISAEVSGNTAVIGVPSDDVGGNVDQGSAYVFARSGGSWSQQARLTASDGQPSDLFGQSVAVAGDTALVGARGDNSQRGSAYVFVRGAGVWGQQQRLEADDGAASDRFGVSVSLSGETALVGAYQDDGNQGSAYVFVRSAGVWSQQQRLTAPDGAASDFFGASVAVDGDLAVVGAYGDDNVRGSAYVFARSGAVWSFVVKPQAADRQAGDKFGQSVALSGNTVLAGASDKDAGLGAAYVFALESSGWGQQAKLTRADGAAGDYFGNSVALNGDVAVVGSPENDGRRGSVYRFNRGGTVWTEQPQYVAADRATDDYYGNAVALSEDTLVVGAYQDDVGANGNQGSAYTYELRPYAPEQLSARAVSARRIDLEWIDASGIETGFEVQRSIGSGWTPVFLDANFAVWQDYTVQPNQTYAYRVRAFDADGPSAWSNTVYATTPGEVLPPAAPSGLYATANAANQLLLRWTDNATNEDGFTLQRSTDRNTWTQILDGTSNTVQFTENGLTSGATYYYRVRAYNGNGTSAWSEIATGVVLPGLPAAPTSLRVATVNQSQLLLGWRDRSTNETGFKIERKLVGGVFAQVGTALMNANSFMDSDLTAGTQYVYRVRATNATGDSGYSNEEGGATQPAPPAAPSNLTATPLSNRVVALAWTDNSTNEAEFRLERKQGTAPFAQIAVIIANGTSFFDSAVAPSTVYTYRIRAANAGGASAYSNQINGATPAGTTEGVLRVNPTALRFSNIAAGSTSTAKLTVSNAGKGKLKVVVGQLAPPFEVLGTRTFTLKAKEQRVLKVRYTATETSKGTATTLGVAGSGRKSPVITVPVTAD